MDQTSQNTTKNVYPHVHKENCTNKEEATRGAAYARIVSRVPKMIARTMELARPLAYASEV